jgi:shikimate kinase
LTLIGPVGVGKSTTARLQAERLSLPHHVLDELRWSYFQQIKYDPAHVDPLAATQGIAAVLAYWERFEVRALEQVLTEYRTGIIFVRDVV